MNWDRDTGAVKVWSNALKTDDRMRMRIAIPSTGRAGAVHTLAHWPGEWLPFTYLVVPEPEARAYKATLPGVKQIIVDPALASGIAATRQYIWDQAQDVEFVLQVSDDLRFAWRDKELKLHGATDAQVCTILDTLYRLLAHGWMHVGLSTRAGNNRVSEDIKAIGRMCDVYGHRHHQCRQLGVRWDRVPLMEDFDVTLQLLRMGHPNAIIYSHCWDQNGSNAEGGCSQYRTPDRQEQAAHALAALHPDFVTVVNRPSKNWHNFGGERVDVRMKWRAAFDSWPHEHGKAAQPADIPRPMAPKKSLPTKGAARKVLPQKTPTKKVLPPKAAPKKALPTKRAPAPDVECNQLPLVPDVESPLMGRVYVFKQDYTTMSGPVKQGTRVRMEHDYGNGNVGVIMKNRRILLTPFTLLELEPK